MAAKSKCLAKSNKSRVRGKASKNLLALTAASPLLDGVDLQDKPSICPKEQIDVASLQTTEQKPVALEIVDGLGKTVVLIASTAAIVVFGIILVTMSSLP
jgi:hypothetical protein